MKSLCLPVLLLLGGSVVGADDKPPAPKLPLGKETTYVTGPLDKQGYIDYEAALNAELGRGITPEKNANVLLIQAFGPAPEGGNGLPPAYFKWLDAPAPPREGEYFVGINTFARNRLALTDNQLMAVFEQQSQATRRPWSAKDFTVIAEWLKANEKPLAVASEATKRPEYYNPLVTNRKEGQASSLLEVLLPSVQKCRELATAFTARAMLRLNEGKFNDAWADLLACHRLSRLLSRGATLIEGLVAVAIGQIAHNSTLAYLDNAKLTGKQAADRLKELRALPPFAPVADRIDLGERFMGLDSLQNIRRGGVGQLNALAGGAVVKPTAEELKALDAIDWTPGLKNLNQWYDRMATAMRLKERADREKEFAKIEKELTARKKDATAPDNLAKLLLGKGGADKTVSKTITDVLMGLLTPAVQKVQSAYDRVEQVERNLHVAFAMAAFRADTGKYPAKLNDLVPKYLPAVPGDIFSGKPLIYKPSEKGYLFYSVGQNGKDDGGRWYDDEPQGDDPGVRMPLPPLKKQ